MSPISSSMFGSTPIASSSLRPDELQNSQLNSDANALVRNAADGQGAEKSELREAFNNFVGATLFGQLLKSMRSTVGKPAYMHGGQTEEIFQSQLDTVLTEELTEASAESYANPMFELFQMSRQ